MTTLSPSSPARPPIPLTRRLRYYLEAGGFFLIVGFFRLFDIDRASAIGGWLGRNLVAPTGFSKLARENLRLAFPEKSAAEIDSVVRGMWDNLGRVLAEYAHLDKIHWKGADPRIIVSGLQNASVGDSPAAGRFFLSGHLANWEVLPIAGRQVGLSGASVVRPANNPLVNRWLEKVRVRVGMPEIVSKGTDSLRRLFTLLRQGKDICLLADQRASEGIPVPFFGHDALTTPMPAALALKLGSAIVPISNERTGGARFHIHVHPRIELPHTGDPRRDLIAVTAAINAFLEERVRAHPEQWLWIHRRWVSPEAPLRKRAQVLSSGGGATSATSSRV